MSAAEEGLSRTVLVLGATGHLGRAIAVRLAARGDRLVLVARDRNRLQGLISSLSEAQRRRCWAVDVDLCQSDAVARVTGAVDAAALHVDDLVISCGPFPRTPLGSLNRGDLEQAFAIHVTAPLLLVRALSASLAESKGAVVAIGDGGLARPYPFHVAYLAAKGALEAALRALAVELAPAVRCNLVAPGIVTDPEDDGDPVRAERLQARSLVGRFGKPEEVSEIVVALLQSRWASGEVWGVGR